MGDLKLLKTLVWLAIIAGAAWFAFQWLQDNPSQPDLERINRPITIPQPNPLGN